MTLSQVFFAAVQHIDNLPREKAFFKGPAPLLLSSLSPDDLTFLLLGSDPKTSQVHHAYNSLGHPWISCFLMIPLLQQPCCSADTLCLCQECTSAQACLDPFDLGS